jgi:hypothetical protein
MKKEKERMLTFGVSDNTAKTYEAMYPTLRSGVINAVNGWPEIWYHTVAEIKGKFSKDMLLLFAKVTEDREYDPVMMVDGEYLIKSLEVFARHKEIPEYSQLVNLIKQLTAAQKYALADWCYQFNKMPEEKTKLFSLLI